MNITQYTFNRQIRLKAFLIVAVFLLFPTIIPAQGIWRAASSVGFTGRYGASATLIEGKVYVIGGQIRGSNVDLVEVYDPQTDSWGTPIVTGSFTPRRNFASVFINGKIYTLGGDLGIDAEHRATDLVEVFDPKTNTWSTLSSSGLSVPLRAMKPIVIGSKIYAFGGIDDTGAVTPIVIFDVLTNTWTTPNTKGIFNSAGGISVAMVNNKVHVFGGALGAYPNYVFRNSVDIFDLATNTWSTLSTTGHFTPRIGATSAIINGKIYVLGGSNNSGFSDAVEVFDPSTNTWTTPSTTGTFTPRNGASSILHNGEIMVIGGSDGFKWNANEILNPDAIDPKALRGTWTTASSTGFTPRQGLSSSVVDGNIYAIGGQDSTFKSMNTLEKYDPMTNTWTTPITKGIFNPRGAGTSNVVDGKIYLIGGLDSSDNLIYSVDVFDPQTNTWSTPETKGDFISRYDLTSCVYGGKIYIFGGKDGISYISDVDVFDPTTNTWLTLSTTGNLFTGRKALTSCTFNGKMYVMCGYNGVFLNSIDIFDPINNSWSAPVTLGELIPNLYLTSGEIAGKVYIIGGNTLKGLAKSIQAYDLVSGDVSPVVTTGWFTPRDVLSSSTVNGKIYVLGGFDGNTNSLNTNEIFTPSPINGVANNSTSADETQISPNPTSGIITLHDIPTHIVNITVMNVLGESMLKINNPKGSDFKIDLSRLPSGSYFVRLLTENSVITKMIIRQ